MRFLRPPLRFWTICAAVAVTAALIIGREVYSSADADLKEELVKIYIQAFFAATVIGVLTSFMNVRRDEDQRDLVRDSTVREIIEQVRLVHRKLKMVKRRMRSQMHPAPERLGGARALPYSIATLTFERAMDDLLAAQIEAEQVRDSISARRDLLKADQIDRIHKTLNYVARYAHDVYQSFEDCRVGHAEDRYHIDESCFGLVDFLGRQAWGRQKGDENTDNLTDAFECLKDEKLSIEKRFAAFETMEIIRKSMIGKPRYRIVATECIALAAADLQDAMKRTRWIGVDELLRRSRAAHYGTR